VGKAEAEMLRKAERLTRRATGVGAVLCRAGSDRGVEAVEFALILPILLLLYFGMDELAQGVLAERRAAHTASTIGDLVSQSSTITQAEVGDIFNVGSGQTISVNRLVELLGGPIQRLPKRPGEPDCTFADVSKIQQRLGWRARVPFEQGVKVMLDHIQLWKDAPVWDERSIAAATAEWFTHLGR